MPTQPSPQMIHYSQVVNFPVGHPLHVEVAAYQQMVPQLLATGMEGRWLLLRDGVLLADFATDTEALTEGYTRFGLGHVFVLQVREYEPLVRTSLSRVA